MSTSTIKLKDVLDSTQNGRDSLNIYSWIEDTVITTSYATIPLYVAGIEKKDILSAGQKFDGYSVYNKGKTSITLKIPPIAAETYYRNGEMLRAKSTSYEHWDISLIWRIKNKEGLLKELICAYNKNRAVKWPLSPTFGNYSAGIVDTAEKSIHGYAVENTLSNGGICYKINFHNGMVTYQMAKWLNLA